MRARRLRLLLPAVVVGVLLSAPALAGRHASVPGDLVVARLSGGAAVVEWYHPDGSRNRQVEVGKARGARGVAFDAVGILYVTDSVDGRVVRLDRSGKRLGSFGSGFAEPGSVVFDRAGNAYVGQRDELEVVKLDPRGARVTAIDLEVEEGGESGQIDLASDQCTLYYRSRRTIRRFDACQGRDLGDFADLAQLRDEGNQTTGAVRILPSGGVLVADHAKIVRLSPSGQVVKDYDVDGEDKWSCFALDPRGGGKYFWAAGGDTGKVYRFNLRTGAVERELPISDVSGLAVQGSSTSPPAPPPAKTREVERTERDTKTGDTKSDKTPTTERTERDTKSGDTKSNDTPTTATLPFAARGTSPTNPNGSVGAQTGAPTGGSAQAPSSPRGAELGRGQAVTGAISNPDQARAQARNPTSGTGGASGDLSISQLDFSAEPQAQPEPAAPPPLVAPEAAPPPAPSAPLVQAQVEPPPPVGMTTERTYRGFLASGGGPADEGWPFVVGSAAVMLFGAGLAGRRRAERARAIPLSARVRTYPRRR